MKPFGVCPGMALNLLSGSSVDLEAAWLSLKFADKSEHEKINTSLILNFCSLFNQESYSAAQVLTLKIYQIETDKRKTRNFGYAGAGIWTRVESLEGSRARPDYTTPA